MRAEYLILADGPGWRVRFNGREFPSNKSQAETIATVLRSARHAASVGLEPMVKLQQRDGQWLTIWPEAAEDTEGEPRGVVAGFNSHTLPPAGPPFVLHGSVSGSMAPVVRLRLKDSLPLAL